MCMQVTTSAKTECSSFILLRTPRGYRQLSQRVPVVRNGGNNRARPSAFGARRQARIAEDRLHCVFDNEGGVCVRALMPMSFYKNKNVAGNKSHHHHHHLPC